MNAVPTKACDIIMKGGITSGVVYPLERIPDPVFAQKLVGDGLSIDPTDSILLAPCDGEVMQLHPALRAEPEGTIDPMVSLVSFWNGEEPVAVLSYYATHPQSYYRTGIANPDFPGIARFMRQLAVPGALHVHFIVCLYQ